MISNTFSVEFPDSSTTSVSKTPILLFKNDSFPFVDEVDLWDTGFTTNLHGGHLADFCFYFCFLINDMTKKEIF